jgi:2-oxoglutarate ferredoxin oxidoreductase subunit alpha
MATGDLALGQEQGTLNAARKRVSNDFSIIVATVNGSGSQSANSVLLKSIFGMGVPVSGKNLFPSNIAGLPTWYTIRASKDGYVARKRGSQILIALNPETAKQDMLSMDSGGAAIYEESFNLKQYRDDVACYPVPFDKITAAICPEPKLRKLVKNMVYVGVAAQLLSIDLASSRAGRKSSSPRSRKVFDLNFGAVKAASTTPSRSSPSRIPTSSSDERRPRARSSSTATPPAAMGAMFAGVTVVAWYPITPSTSLVEEPHRLLKKFRVTPKAKPPSPSFRPKTSSPPSAWCSAQAGPARAP